MNFVKTKLTYRSLYLANHTALNCGINKACSKPFNGNCDVTTAPLRSQHICIIQVPNQEKNSFLCAFSRVWHRLHVFPRLVSCMVCFEF